MRLTQRTFAVLVFSLVLGMAGAAPVAFAQETSVANDQRIYEIKTKDGARYYGYVRVDEPDRVVLRTPGGATIELARDVIVSMAESKGQVIGGEFRAEDPNPTRLFFGPTGRSLKKGEAYFGVYEIIMPFVQVGLTDRLSIGGGTPLVVGGGASVFWLTPKFQLFEGGRTSVSVGTLHFLSDEDSFGIAYAAATFGSRDDALTVALGRAYTGSPTDTSGGTVIMIGGELRISRRLKLITENHFVEGEAILTGGFRLLGESLTVDIGLLAPSGASIAIPMLNFVWKIK